MPLQMNFELTKIFKAKLRVCHCEIRFLTLLLMYAYFPPHFLLQFYASLFTAGMGDTALPKGVSNTLIHLGEEAAAVFFFFSSSMNILKASCHARRWISLCLIAEQSELLTVGLGLANFISSARRPQRSLCRLSGVFLLFSVCFMSDGRGLEIHQNSIGSLSKGSTPDFARPRRAAQAQGTGLSINRSTQDDAVCRGYFVFLGGFFWYVLMPATFRHLNSRVNEASHM